MGNPVVEVNTHLAGADDGRNQIKALTGGQYHYVANCGSADVTLSGANLKCRFIECDSEGIIKVTYKSDGGAERTMVRKIQPGEKVLVQNVTVVHRYYVGTTACTAQTYNDAGSLVTGIRLIY